ncbi:alpha/beta hydrolase [Pseudomonas palleroniana]|uniref:alpha/beta hydrolase n=1 Tax=Pseudomonas palleroniana TaxID=191390 RepID=UPI001FD03B56|nr:alpha/beta hydrolase [Pseudomonas palleroniana]UOP10280.1 alpha/beta hydrolase [Pseudomonas palleroniana]
MTQTYPLDAAMQAYVEASQRFCPADGSLAARREAFLRACRACTPAAPDNWRIDDLHWQGLRLRCYRPDDITPVGGWPTLLYIHGGGWDLGSLDTHDWFAYALGRRLTVAIVAVDYRLAPEHSYPAPLEDCLDVWHGLRQGLVDPDLSTERLMVIGDSAGGTLAAGLCMALRRDGHPQPSAQVLIYPVLTVAQQLPSMQEHANAPMMTVTGLAKSLEGFLPNAQDRLDPCAMPLEAKDFRGLAPTFVAVAQIDPLRDHGMSYQEVLAADGVDTQLHIARGMVHSGLRAFGAPVVEAAWDSIALFVENKL